MSLKAFKGIHHPSRCINSRGAFSLFRCHALSHSHLLDRRHLLASSGAMMLLLANDMEVKAQQSETIPTPRVKDSATTLIDVVPTRIKTSGRIIAIGDLHGDWRKAVDSLRAAGVATVRESDNEILWVGGDTVVVQLGDVMDRGDHEITIVKLLRNMNEQARSKGGAVFMLNGNHESLNVSGDFRYVTRGAFVESALFAGLTESELKGGGQQETGSLKVKDFDRLARARSTVFQPGGKMAMELSKNPVVLIVNDTAFAHGGLLPQHVKYGLEKLNQETSAWMRADETDGGKKAPPPFLVMGDDNSVQWNRSLSSPFSAPNERNERNDACRELQEVLIAAGASRLVVGHTPQIQGANCECECHVWRLDVGMSSGVLNSPVQVLEIKRVSGHDELAIRQ